MELNDYFAVMEDLSDRVVSVSAGDVEDESGCLMVQVGPKDGPFECAYLSDVAAEELKDSIIEFLAIKHPRCPKCLDRPGKDGLGRTCKNCSGTGSLNRIQ